MFVLKCYLEPCLRLQQFRYPNYSPEYGTVSLLTQLYVTLISLGNMSRMRTPLKYSWRDREVSKKRGILDKRSN